LVRHNLCYRAAARLCRFPSDPPILLERARPLFTYHAIVANECRFLTEIRIRFVFQHEGVQIQALTLDG